MTILIKNAYVVSMDTRIGNLPRADILVENGKIVDIRPNIEAENVEVIDASGHIASPGFVDTHHHFWQCAIRGVTSDWSILDYVCGMRMVLAAAFDPEDMYAAQFFGALQALNAGVTTTADYCHNLISPDHAEESIRGVRDSGARVSWGYGFNTPPVEDSSFPDISARLDYLKKIATTHFASTDDLVTLSVCPEEACFWPNRDVEYAQPQFEVAREIGARIFWHANDVCDLLTGEPPREAALINEAGLLGTDLTLVHMGVTDEDEWDLVAHSGTHISMTPEIELQMGLGWPNIQAVRTRGINFSFGIDITSNNNVDLRYQLRMALQNERHLLRTEHIGKLVPGLPLSCEDALYWGTMGGAKAMGLDHKIGSLSPGKSADIVLHDTRDISMVGWNRDNPAAALIIYAGADSVSTVMVNGCLVKKDFILANEKRACDILGKTSDKVYSAIKNFGGFQDAVDQGRREMEGILGRELSVID